VGSWSVAAKENLLHSEKGEIVTWMTCCASLTCGIPPNMEDYVREIPQR